MSLAFKSDMAKDTYQSLAPAPQDSLDRYDSIHHTGYRHPVGHRQLIASHIVDR